MRCPNCGKELQDNEKFCTYCGFKLEQIAAEENNVKPKPIVIEKKNGIGKNKTIYIIVGIALLAIIIAVVAMFVTGKFSSDDKESASVSTEESVAEEEESSDDEKGHTTVEDVKVTAHDINYSKIADQRDDVARLSFSKNAVDCLMVVENNGDSPIYSIEFEVNVGDYVMENRMGGKTFEAIGFIPAHEKGFMYSGLYISEDDGFARKNGSIKVKTILSEGDGLDDYEVPGGYMGDYNKGRDSYSVNIENPNDRMITKGSTIVIVRGGVNGKLAGRWGAGELDTDIAPNDDYHQEDAIYNPGLSGDFDPADYSVLVFDGSVY